VFTLYDPQGNGLFNVGDPKLFAIKSINPEDIISKEKILY